MSESRTEVLLNGETHTLFYTKSKLSNVITAIQKERKVSDKAIQPEKEMRQPHWKGIKLSVFIYSIMFRKLQGLYEKIIRIKNVRKVSMYKNNMQKQIIFLFHNNQ